jgi:hypothetical protein
MKGQEEEEGIGQCWRKVEEYTLPWWTVSRRQKERG